MNCDINTEFMPKEKMTRGLKTRYETIARSSYDVRTLTSAKKVCKTTYTLSYIILRNDRLRMYCISSLHQCINIYIYI